MSYLVDTNVVSELRKGSRANPGVLDWLGDTAEEDLYLSVLTLGELRKGVERIRRRDKTAGRALGRWLRSLARDFADRLLPVDSDIAQEWGRLNAADPVPVIDGLLAATALVNGMTLVTRNVKDVEGTGVPVVDPFS